MALGQPRWPARTPQAKKLVSQPHCFLIPAGGAADTFLPLLAKIGGKSPKQEVALLMEKAGVIFQACPGWGGRRASFKGHRVTQPKKQPGEEPRLKLMPTKLTSILSFHRSASTLSSPLLLRSRDVKRSIYSSSLSQAQWFKWAESNLRSQHTPAWKW